jgi:hypothetical protein
MTRNDYLSTKLTKFGPKIRIMSSTKVINFFFENVKALLQFYKAHKIVLFSPTSRHFGTSQYRRLYWTFIYQRKSEP